MFIKALLTVFTLAPQAALAATLYVSPSGSDSNVGSATAPFQTLQKGISSARPGDAITVAPGAYPAVAISTSVRINIPLTTPTPTPAPTPKPPTFTATPTIIGLTTTSMTVQWSISEPSTGQVEYGTTTAFGKFSTLETRLLSRHTQILRGLTAGTTYQYRVISKNAAGGVAVSPVAGFTTVKVVQPSPTPIPSAGTCNFNVGTLAQLKSSLTSARSGQVICVANNAVIDVTNEPTLTIPGGVTLRSDRSSAIPASGAPLGAKILSAATKARGPLIQTGGDDVKIIGLRFEGPLRSPHAAEGKEAYANGTSGPFQTKYISRGVSVRHNRTLIEATEAYGFGHYAIAVGGGTGNIIRNSFMHHNQLYGYGYGVMSSGASSTLITNNIFDYNRHAIASGGSDGNRYEASYNVAYRHHPDMKSNHEFDVHGQGDTGGQHTGGTAGEYYSIHHNTFYLSTAKAFLLRGYPTVGIRIYNNRAVHASFSTAYVGSGGGEVAIQESMSMNTGNVFSIGQPASYPVYPTNIYPIFN